MSYQEAIDYIRELLTKLHANTDICEDSTPNVIVALEDYAIPAIEILKNFEESIYEET